LNSVGSIYRPQTEINAYLMVGKPTLRDKFLNSLALLKVPDP